MNVLISGGAKNGKSYYAQKIARQMADEGSTKSSMESFAGPPQGETLRPRRLPLYYIATMIPHDEEDQARIRRHIAERDGWGFKTLEQGTDLTVLLQRADSIEAQSPQSASPEPDDGNDVFCQSSAPPERIDRNGVFLLDSVTALLSNEMFRQDGTVDHGAPQRVAEDCAAFAKATGNTVFVSDYIYGDAGRYDALTEEYRKGLALIDRRLAEACDRVIEVSAGIIEEWKTE